jgi:hypothetical protein
VISVLEENRQTLKRVGVTAMDALQINRSSVLAGLLDFPG